MDISDILDPYRAAVEGLERAGETGAVVGVLIGILITVITTVAVCRNHRRRTSDKVRYTMVALVLGIVFGTLLGWSLGMRVWVIQHDPEPSELKMAGVETIQERVADAYGVEISTAKIMEAWRAGDEDVVLFGGVHDGVQKSLGIQMDEDVKTITVYEGNVALDAARR